MRAETNLIIESVYHWVLSKPILLKNEALNKFSFRKMNQIHFYFKIVRSPFHLRSVWTSSVRGRPDISINCWCSVTWRKTAKAVFGNRWLIRCWNQLFKRYSKTKNTNATSKWTYIHYKDHDSKSPNSSSLRWGKSEAKKVRRKCDTSIL